MVDIKNGLFVQLNSQVLYYEKTGEGSPLLLLHGNGEDHSIFDALIPHLKVHFTVYTPDSRGCGLSSDSVEYHYMDMMEDMKNFIDTLGIGRASVVGFSDGGIIAILLAISYPDYVNRLVLCGANLSPSGLTFSARLQIKAEYRKTRSAMVAMMLKEPNISAESLRRIKSKTLVVAGEKDMVKPKETKKIADSIPDSTLRIIQKADHGSYIIHNDMLKKELINFLA